jgi:hypothetical protein
MERYSKMVSRFRTEVGDLKESEEKSFLDCKLDWDFNAQRFLKKGSKPHLVTYFKFCINNKYCPVQKMIVYLREFIDPHALIAFICKEFNITNLRYE